MNSFFKWFSLFFAGTDDASSKRLVAIFLVLAYVVHYFLVTYLKIEIANAELVKSGQNGVFTLILVFGGFITYENYLKLKPGGKNNQLEDKP